MPFRLDPNQDPVYLLEFASRVVAGLRVASELSSLAAPWENLQRKARDTRDEWLSGRERMVAAESRWSILTFRWDHTVGLIESRARALSNDLPMNAPYSTLFGRHAAFKLETIGVPAAIELGEHLAAMIRRSPHTDLTPLGEEVDARTRSLDQGSREYETARADWPRHEGRRVSLIREIARQMTLTERAIRLKHEWYELLLPLLLTPPE
jgi:hypothetical protein